jgi:quinoprotein glucose dehydrogenase
MAFRLRKSNSARFTLAAPRFTLAAVCLAVCCIAPLAVWGADSTDKPAQRKSVDWPVYGGPVASDHYSSLSQINRTNVDGLRQAWKFDTGEKGILQTSPIIIGDVLYAFTPTQKVIALDAASGKLLWKFDSGILGTAPARGLAYWTNGKERRIFAGVMNFLYALNPATGKPDQQFGEKGRIDLRKGLRGDYHLQDIALTTPGTIYKDLIIVGGREPETHPAPPGDIRAFDVHTGALRWSFHTIPHPGEFGYSTWPKDAWKKTGAANNWAGMSLDAKRGIVYVPTGSAVFDFYGADRVGNDLFADTLLALDAETGKRIWYFQGVHHDLWDRDFPSPPALLTVEHDGKRIDALAQTTKQGYVYLFDRTTGKPLFPIEERKYPASNVPGEVSSLTQPLPTAPKPFARQLLTADMLTTRTAEAHAWALKQFATLRSGGQFIPLSLNKQTVVFPGFDGGAEWGGPAVDPTTGVIYINSNEMAWTGGLTADKPAGTLGESTYQSQCGVCHGSNRTGSPPTFPSLVNIDRRLSSQQIMDKVHQGGGRMPAFPNLSDREMSALLQYLKNGAHSKSAGSDNKVEMAATPLPGASKKVEYRFTGYRKFLDPDGYPAISTPWGTLNAINLNTGEFLWQIPLGEYPALAAKGMTNTGSENYGGPVVTAGGVLFIGATVYDNKFRAIDSGTGKLLWQTQLPSAAGDTPATYMADGKQYVVIAAGGSKDDKFPVEGVYVAFALPNPATD